MDMGGVLPPRPPTCSSSELLLTSFQSSDEMRSLLKAPCATTAIGNVSSTASSSAPTFSSASMPALPLSAQACGDSPTSVDDPGEHGHSKSTRPCSIQLFFIALN